MAKVTDHEVELIRELVDIAVFEGRTRVEAYAWIGRKFGLHPATVKKYAYYLSRIQAPVWKKREEP